MFRLCIDLTTKTLLPKDNKEGLNSSICRKLELRLRWLFQQGILTESLKEFSICIKDDGNDGVHESTFSKVAAEDILNFTYKRLKRIYTEPKRIEFAKQRRDARRAKTTNPNSDATPFSDQREQTIAS